MKQKIKILFIHRSMEFGGVEKVVINQLKNLDKNIFDVTLLLKMYQGGMRDQIPADVNLISLTKGKEDLSKFKLFFLIQLVLRNIKLRFLAKFPFFVERFYLKKKFDLIIAPTYTSFDDVLNSHDKNAKKIAWFHTDIRDGKDHNNNLRLLSKLKKFDWVVFGSRQTQQVIVDEYQINYPSSQVIYNPIDIDGTRLKSKEFQIDYEKRPVFLSIGRLNRRKGYHTLMKAHRLLLDEGIEHSIVLIGDGEENLPLKDQAKELDVEDSFVFYGAKSNPYPYIKACDYYILSSDSESYPLTIGEVLILGKPIISTNVGGISEMMTHDENGLLIDYSAEAMAEAMKSFIYDHDLTNRIINNNKNMEVKFDNSIINRQIEELFVTLAKNRS